MMIILAAIFGLILIVPLMIIIALLKVAVPFIFKATLVIFILIILALAL